jgi:hypothetical protein
MNKSLPTSLLEAIGLYIKELSLIKKIAIFAVIGIPSLLITIFQLLPDSIKSTLLMPATEVQIAKIELLESSKSSILQLVVYNPLSRDVLITKLDIKSSWIMNGLFLNEDSFSLIEIDQNIEIVKQNKSRFEFVANSRVDQGEVTSYSDVFWKKTFGASIKNGHEYVQEFMLDTSIILKPKTYSYLNVEIPNYLHAISTPIIMPISPIRKGQKGYKEVTKEDLTDDLLMASLFRLPSPNDGILDNIKRVHLFGYVEYGVSLNKVVFEVFVDTDVSKAYRSLTTHYNEQGSAILR